VRMYVCMYVRMYVCMYVYTHTHTHCIQCGRIVCEGCVHEYN
jgi:hypothetical protein